MALRAGCRQTDVGVIPEDWALRKLGDIASVAAGGTPSRKIPAYWGGDIPWVTTTEINFNTITVAEQHITELGLKNSAARLLAPGTLLLALYGQGRTRGKVGVLGIRATANQACASIVISSSVNRTYVFHLLASRYDAIRALSNSGSQENLSGQIVRSIPVPLPPTEAEQNAIAEALSDADVLVDALGRLLAKKRDLKHAAMEKLLTGGTRLQGFVGEWRTRRLGEVIAHCSSGATPYRGHREYYKGDVRWITSGELNYNVITDTIEKISKEAIEKTNLKVHPVGTFLMAITGLEAAGTRGACGIVGSPATTNQSCMAIYPTSELSPSYLYQYYVLRGNSLALEYCQGTKQQSYTAKIVRILPIDLPPSIREQTAIAAVLSDMDTEIATLEAKLAKARQIKLGMMQNLITGKIRLV